MIQRIKRILQIIINKFGRRRKLISLFLGILLCFALPPYFQFWTVLIAFSGAIYLCIQAKSLWNLAGIGYWFGFGFFAGGLYWIGNALLIDIKETGYLYPLVLFLNGAFFGLFTIPPFLVTRAGKNVFAKIFYFAAAWFLSTEWLRSFLFTGFPWNPLSSVLAFRPALLQTLAWWGTYGLSMIIIIIAAIPVIWLLRPTRQRAWSIIVSIFLFGMLWEHGAYVLAHADNLSDGQSIMVRLVQPNIPQTLKWDKAAAEENFRQYIDLSQEKDNQHLDFVIWGETASPFDLTYDEKHLRQIRSAVPLHGYLITGLLRYELNERNRYIPYNSLAVITRKGHIWDIYDKNHLVPFGEYIPLRQYLPQWVRPIANNVAEFGRGEKYKTITIDGYPEFAPLICYEIIFSDDIIRKDNKPKWIILVTNDGWYGISSGPYQHLVAAQMRAIEEGITIVRSANSGISAVITPYGQVTAKIPLATHGFKDVPVKLDLAHDTLFGRYGNTIPLLMCGEFIFLAWLISKIFPKK